MTKIVKILYISIIFVILLLIVTLPLMLITFELEESLDTSFSMIEKLKEFIDL